MRGRKTEAPGTSASSQIRRPAMAAPIGVGLGSSSRMPVSSLPPGAKSSATKSAAVATTTYKIVHHMEQAADESDASEGNADGADGTNDENDLLLPPYASSSAVNEKKRGNRHGYSLSIPCPNLSYWLCGGRWIQWAWLVGLTVAVVLLSLPPGGGRERIMTATVSPTSHAH